MFEYFHFLRDEHPWLMRVAAFYMGACVGSFLNVCILRIPAGKSIVFPGSHCSCGKPIAWYDNIPILSWFILRGRARCCGAKFSIRYAVIEAVTASAFLWLWVAYSPTSLATALAGMILFSLLLLGAMIDVDHLILPDITTIGGLFVGLIISLCWPQLHGLYGAAWSWAEGRQSLLIGLTGVVVGAGVVYWIGEFGNFFLRRPSMGYGDMLLMGCLGAFCGWQGTLAAIFGGATIACVFLVATKLFHRPAPPEEPAKEEPVAGEPEEASPLGRRHFAMNWILLITSLSGAIAWRLHRPDAALAMPTCVFPALLVIVAAWKGKKLVLNEAWLLLAVVVGVIVSCATPRAYGIELSNIWLVDAMPAGILSMLGAVVGAGVALWLLEFANIFRSWFFPVSALGPELGEYDQIWGEGYLLLFGGVGAFGGWRMALVGTGVFAIVGTIFGCFHYLGALQAARKQSPAKPEPEAAAEVPLATSGFEVPFGPWLALAGFIYFAWLAPYFDLYLGTLRATLMGEMPK